MSDKKYTPEPFGYFKAEPFGWTDCAETDDGAVPLYERNDIEMLMKQRDELLTSLRMALPFVEDHEGDPCYKKGAVAKAVNTIRAAIVKGGA